IFIPGAEQDHLKVAGAANGIFDLPEIVAGSVELGEQAAHRAAGKTTVGFRREPIEATSHYEESWQPVWFIPGSSTKDRGGKHFVDFQNDVVASGLELAVREGYRSVEHVKRYTTLGMATDQGKTSNINALGILSNALDKPIPEIGTTTFRPPYTPVSFGAIAGLEAKDLFQAVRQSPVSSWHHANGANYEPVGLWRRPYCFPRHGEDRAAAVNREVLTVRREAGIIDLSTLGKIEVKGPDAGTFLDLIYTNIISSLKSGKCRYGLTMDDQGYLIDDGVVVRLADDRFLVHTTSGNADRMAAWMELWLQTEWTGLKVYVTPVSEQWAQFAVAGPRARDILEKLPGNIKWDRESFPPLAMQTGRLIGQQVRIYRISYSGELSFEIAIPANHGLALWTAILQAGEEFGVAPYGTEALHVLRAEKGFIAIGDETDGTVTPLDLGLNWAVSKKKPDFIGKRALQRPFMADHGGRKQLVGILTNDPAVVLPDGSQVIDTSETQPPPPVIGHVSSSYWSPTLGRSIALALIVGGTARHGETVYFPVGDRVEPGTIVEPVFYDQEGARQNV
ncbi:MAG: hypothetical protein K8F25_06220, partial [Fimbriimonadaceae bacterium]|nr:hypothetical protein [Alphaproteobacteria bacterium]